MIKPLLRKIAELQVRYPIVFLVVILLLTSAIATGVPYLEVQSDFNKENPRQLPAYVLTDRISDEFGGENTVVLLLEVDETDENQLVDLRQREVVDFMIDLEETLMKDSRVIKTSSLGTIMKNVPYESREDIKNFMEQVPQTKQFFSEDYRMTFITITTNIGGSYEDAVPFLEMLDEKISSVNYPGGVKHIVTGFPPFGKVIRETVFSDAAKTILYASLGIFLLLLITERSLIKSVLVFVPLLFALVWAGGILGFSGMKLSIASVALGSIILGLGVEYGVFMLTRYKEERFDNKKSQLDANKSSVSNIGAALLGSGTTTIAGFLALTFSITPMMQVLGITLAVGILGCILSAIFVAPLLIVLAENYEIGSLKKNLKGMVEKNKFYEESK